MTRIGLLSDTHSYFDPRFKELFANCDEIWHAGDIGDIRVLDDMRQLKLLVLYMEILMMLQLEQS
ncbi:hypothetical protein JCM21142_72571 [Saccharicrinis fermentans DSM 9555 = JCM 21142]|uniref:Calcineurin-like phosphoesterase domain-containing protein n=1 Tax=Saccharicrinis fermentans DSM 9555 = JCM 21142 TaxID=869213 RepID=W7Y863_9BACT|nr:hypothetical protein JCM21142_72571 [Saccharicrinis fermentans DSM 9555 = JCM 21142]